MTKAYEKAAYTDKGFCVYLRGELIAICKNSLIFLVAMGGVLPCNAGRESPFMSISKLREFPNSDKLRVEARTSGVINHISEGQTEIAIQDGKFAIWMPMHVNRPRDLKLGQQVEVEGYLQKGKFAPDFVVQTLDVVGEPGLPEPESVTGSELLSGSYDCRFIKLSGIVRAVHPWSRLGRDHAIMHLNAKGTRILVLTPSEQLDRLSKLVDGVVEIKGIDAVAVNEAGQVLTSQMRVTNPEFIEILEPPRAESMLPLTPLKSLLGHPVSGSPGHRIRTQGTVTHTQNQESFQIQDQGHGVRVWTSGKVEPPALNSVVEVLGFPTPGPLGPTLEDGQFRIIGTNTALEPAIMKTAQEAFSHEGRLVRVTGRLVETQTDVSPARLMLKDGNLLFAADFNGSIPRDALPAEPGAVITVTGIAEGSVGSAQQEEGYLKPRDLLIHLRSPADVQCLESAPWWTPLRLAVALAATGSVLVTVLFFAGLLTRKNKSLVAAEYELVAARDALAKRVETRTDQLHAQLSARRSELSEYSAVTAERNRLARDLHDSLEQTLAGAALRIDAANDLLPHGETAEFHLARRQMEKAAQLLRISQAEVRRTVWGLRSLALEKNKLADALRESVRLLTEDTGITTTLDLYEDDTGLSNEHEDELLYIAQEAIANVLKHSRATILEVAMLRKDGKIILTVKDNGLGFDPLFIPTSNSRPHYGQQDMRERAQLIGATLDVRSVVGGGSYIEVSLTHST
jgi:signal transduction histidine kinase